MANKILEDAFRSIQITEDVQIAPDTNVALGGAKPTNKILEDAFQSVDKQDELSKAINSYESLLNDAAVRQAAVRFAKDRLGKSNIDEDEAIDDFISHFRSFDVNEMTAAGDFNYVSAAAADSSTREDAAQRLADYQKLYTAFRQMPAFYEEGGAGGAFGDYLYGIATAPSTYIGLLTGGAGKAGGVAATQAAKEAVKLTLRQKLKRPVTGMINLTQKRPVATTMAVEGGAGVLQDIAAQKTEIAASLRDEYDPTQSLITGIASGALPAGLALRQAKGKFSDFAERNVGDLLGDAEKATLARNEKAEIAAEKTISKNKKVASEVKILLRPLDPEGVKSGEKVRDVIREEIEAGYKKGTGLDKEIIAPDETFDYVPEFSIILDPGLRKRVFAATVELVAEGGGRKPGERVTEAIARIIRDIPEEKIRKEFQTEILEKYNLTSDDFANLFMADYSAAGKTLQQASAVKKMLDAVNDDLFGFSKVQQENLRDAWEALEANDVRKFVEKTQSTTDDLQKGNLRKFYEVIKAADSARLAFMTSQTATTIRNTASGVTRVGFDVLTKAFDRGIASSLKKFGAASDKVSLFSEKANEDALAVLYGITNKKEAIAIQEVFKQGFGAKSTQLFREMQDIADTTDLLPGNKISTVRKIGAELNALNTLSDNMFKRAAFVGSLKRQLNELYTRKLAAGEITSDSISDFNLRNIVRDGRFNEVFVDSNLGKEALDNAIEEALYFTYQKTPDNATARALIDTVHNAPFLLTSLVPFPRFIMNAMRFTYEYSPLYLVDAGFINRAAKNADNYEEISKGLVGTGVLMGATAYRYHYGEGTAWYEGRTQDGSTFDMRPFFPAAPFLYFGDLMARMYKNYEETGEFMEGSQVIFGDVNEVADAVQALSGTQFRAGFGMYALDQTIRDLSGEKDTDKFQKAMINAAANVLSTYTIPVTALQDTYNTFIAPDEARIIREKRSTDMMGMFIHKSIARLPGNYILDDMIMEARGMPKQDYYESPTRPDILRRMTPLTRQTMGILKNEKKNYFEKELAKHKINRNVISSRTGIPEADTLINQFMGEYIDEYVIPRMQSDKDYQEADGNGKKYYIQNIIDDFKKDIMDLVRFRSRTYAKEKYGFDPMKAVSFNKMKPYIRDRAFELYHKNHGKPDTKMGYDYQKLLYYGKYFDSMTK